MLLRVSVAAMGVVGVWYVGSQQCRKPSWPLAVRGRASVERAPQLCKRVGQQACLCVHYGVIMFHVVTGAAACTSLRWFRLIESAIVVVLCDVSINGPVRHSVRFSSSSPVC